MQTSVATRRVARWSSVALIASLLVAGSATTATAVTPTAGTNVSSDATASTRLAVRESDRSADRGQRLTKSDATSRRVRVRLRTMVRKLPVAPERRAGYSRAKFTHWVDADRDRCDTRDEVLIQEAKRKPRVGAGCRLHGGRWVSSYDGVRTRNPSTFDVDHMVPLAEAWDSGARRWNADTRRRYANDLGDRRSLIAVSASSNRSKSDRDPAQWLPKRNQCRYVRDYTAVKTRWHLTVDRREKRSLQMRAKNCRNVRVAVSTARVARSSGGSGTSSGGAGGTKDPRFSYCYQAKDKGFGPYYQGRDPEYAWYTDSDSDGVVCE